MKRYVLSFCFLIINFFILSGQSDPLMIKCRINAGPSSKYIKDFNIQLGEKHFQGDFRYQATISLRKNTKYRFTMCTDEHSKGQLILNVRDNANNTILSSYDKDTGIIYPYKDLNCKKNGVYFICYDFTNGQSGTGVSVVSIVR